MTANEDIAIKLEDVWVQYLLRHAHHYNLKRTLSNFVTRKKESPEVITALKGITLEIPRGARLGLIGPNGSGKSTLLAVMAGSLTPTRGTATIHGKVLSLLGGSESGLDPEQTGRENVISIGVRLGESANRMQSLMDEIKEFSGLGRRFDHPVYSYSSGMQSRLRFSTITTVEADILLVDEGIGAADAEFNERASVRLQEFYERSGTLILASHSEGVLAHYGLSETALDMGRINEQDHSSAR